MEVRVQLFGPRRSRRNEWPGKATKKSKDFLKILAQPQEAV
jgi:hypothetical protein